MELPNYFLADLPDASTLTHNLISEACKTLKRNRERYLLSRPTEKIVHVLASLAQDWLDPEFAFRKMVLENGPAETGFTKETLTSGLVNFFSTVTKENLERLVLQDLGSARRLDEIVADEL